MKHIIYGILLAFIVSGCVIGNDSKLDKILQQPVIELTSYNNLGVNAENISINLYNGDMAVYTFIVDNPKNEIMEHSIKVSPGNNYRIELEVKDNEGDYIAESPILDIRLYEVKTITMLIRKRSTTVKAIWGD